MKRDRDERTSLPLDPEEALRALLRIDPNAEPEQDDEREEDEKGAAT